MKSFSLFLLLLAVCLSLGGCDGIARWFQASPAVPVHPYSVWDDIIAIGHQFLTWGAVAGVAGLAVRLGSIAYPWLKPFSYFASIASYGGAFGFFSGVWIAWLGSNPWVVTVIGGACLLACAAWVWCHRVLVRRWISAREAALDKALTK